MTTGSKLSWHFQTLSNNVAVEQAKASGVKYIKLMDPPEQNPFPAEIKVIGRRYQPDEEFNEMVRGGKSRAWFDWMGPYMEARPWVYAWEVGNEPHPMWDIHFVEMLVTFTMGVSLFMRNIDKTMVGLNLSVGWPFLATFGDSPHSVRELRYAVESLCENGHYMGLHEYSAPHMWDGEGSLCLRYRNTVAELGDPVPNIFITECGIDGGVISRPKTGWRSFTGEAGYLEQLRWYDERLREDDYVEGAFIFNAGGHFDWLDFELEPGMSRALGGYIASVPAEPEPEPGPGPTHIVALVDEALGLVGQSKAMLGD